VAIDQVITGTAMAPKLSKLAVYKKPACKSEGLKAEEAESNKVAAIKPEDPLDVKIAKLRANPNATSADVTQSLTPDEMRCLIGRFKTQASKDQELADQHKQAGDNTSKRILVTAWTLDPNKGEKFASLTASVTATQKVTKTERWMSHKEANKKWSEEELEAHLESGRVIWRETISAGVYEYQDTGDVVISKQIERQKRRSQKDSWDASDEDKELEGLMSFPLGSAAGNLEMIHGNAFGKGTGKAAAVTGGKGEKGKGKGKGKGWTKTPKDPKPEPEPETLDGVYGKLQGMTKLLGDKSLSLQVLFKQASKLQSYKSATKKEHLAMNKEIEEAISSNRNMIVQKKATAEEIKEQLIQQAALVKQASSVMGTLKALIDPKPQPKKAKV
jgi:hypothetical protein